MSEVKFNSKYGIEPFGMFPIQYEGKLSDGNYVYCRARHEHLEVIVSTTPEDYWGENAVHRSGIEMNSCSYGEFVTLCDIALDQYFGGETGHKLIETTAKYLTP